MTKTLTQMRFKLFDLTKASLFFLVAAIGGLAVFVWVTAFRLEVDYSDTLHLLLNARTIAEGGGPYNYHRFIASPLIHVPSFWLESLFKLPGLALRISHLWGALLYSLLLFALFQLFRLSLSVLLSVMGVFLFAFTPIVLHYAPMAKEDLPAVLMVVTAFYFYLRNQSQRDRVLFGIFTALAMGIRYNLIPVLFSIVALSELAGEARKNTLQKVGFYFLLPLLLFFAFPLIIYPWIGHSTILKAVPQFVEELFVQYETNNRAYKTAWLNLIFLIKAIGMPFLLLSGLGMVSAWRDKLKHSRFFFIWLVFSFAYQTAFVAGKEVRYLFICLPPLFYFISLGVSALLELAPGKRVLRIGILAALLLKPVLGTWNEVKKFQDDFYYRPMARDISLTAAKMAEEKNGNLIWVGSYYGSHPKDYVFHLDDDYAYVYHLYTHTVYYFTRKDVLKMEGGKLFWLGGWDKGVWLPEVGPRVKDGDVLIINPENRVIATSTIKNSFYPVLLQRARIVELDPTKDYSAWASQTEARDYEFYLQKDATSEAASFGRVEIKNKTWLGEKPNTKNAKRAFLLYFDNQKVIHAF